MKTDKNKLLKFNIMKNAFFFSLIFVANLVGSQDIKESQIIGSIKNATAETIKIDNNPISISANGGFKFIANIENPTFYDIEYDGLRWSMYLEPGKRIEVSIPKKDVSTIEYRGELTSSNYYLKKTRFLNQDINDFFNRNWVQLHSQNEPEYISIIDSLKELCMKPLSVLAKGDKNISKDFIKSFKAEIDFRFNSLILKYYPESHLVFTGEQVSLSENALSYVNTTEINNPKFFDLPNYDTFCKALIDYKADLAGQKNNEPKYYNLKKTESAFQIIPEILDNQSKIDFWIYKYLIEHIEKNGISNSVECISKFKTICKTEDYINKINKRYTDELNEREGHEIKTYKTINGFILEAHIFKPGDITRAEKRPAIVIFHGGGWDGGNPSWAFGRAKHFSNMGMVAIAAQYRLTNKKDITALESMSDARDLIKWMRSNADSLNIVPDSIVAYGWSAGAHLVSSAAIFCDSIPEQHINSVPNAMILVSPAVSLPKGKGWEFWKYNVFGTKTSVSSANPVEHVRTGLPPTIILQGRDDTVTPLDGVQLFHDKMIGNGNYCELLIYDGVGHLFTPNTMPDNREPHPDKKIEEEAFKKADEFLMEFGYIKK